MYGTTTRLLAGSALAASLLAAAPAASASSARHASPAQTAPALPVSIGTAVAYVRDGDGRPVAVQPTALPH
jgi:hypothetical protein